MDLHLSGKVVFVAGGSRGIGLGMVEALLAEGARVAMTARGAEALETERARLAVQYGADALWTMAGDMRDSAVIETALTAAEAAMGPLWGAVANVGLSPCPPGFEIDDETWSDGRGIDEGVGTLVVARLCDSCGRECQHDCGNDNGLNDSSL